MPKLTATPCILAALAFIPVAASAQSTTTPPQEAQEYESLGEITVTAQRRSENQQSVPIAISAVSAEDVTLLGVTHPQNLTQLVPGFTFQRNSSGALQFLRGVGSTGSIVGSEPPVAIFLDDVYIPTGKAAIFEFNNISLIEALKGPQGTLFGGNATGGVIHVHTKKPSLTDTTWMPASAMAIMTPGPGSSMPRCPCPKHSQSTCLPSAPSRTTDGATISSRKVPASSAAKSASPTNPGASTASSLSSLRMTQCVARVHSC